VATQGLRDGDAVGKPIMSLQRTYRMHFKVIEDFIVVMSVFSIKNTQVTE
jgi:hypothetical protein